MNKTVKQKFLRVMERMKNDEKAEGIYLDHEERSDL
jgi:hypothetical protein